MPVIPLLGFASVVVMLSQLERRTNLLGLPVCVAGLGVAALAPAGRGTSTGPG